MIIVLLLGSIVAFVAFFALLLRVVHSSKQLGKLAESIIFLKLGGTAALDSVLAQRKSRLLSSAGLRGKILDCGSGQGMNLKYLAALPYVTDIICIESNDYFLANLRQAAAEVSRSSGKKVEVFHETLESYLQKHPKEAGTYDGVLCIHSLGRMGKLKATAQIIQIALKKGGKLVFMEASRSKFTNLWQRTCRIPLIVLGGLDLMKDPIKSLSSVGWQKFEGERFLVNTSNVSWLMNSFLSILKSHAMGCAVAREAKGGLHTNADQIMAKSRRKHKHR